MGQPIAEYGLPQPQPNMRDAKEASAGAQKEIHVTNRGTVADQKKSTEPLPQVSRSWMLSFDKSLWQRDGAH